MFSYENLAPGKVVNLNTEDRFIYFFWDTPHLMKTARNVSRFYLLHGAAKRKWIDRIPRQRLINSDRHHPVGSPTGHPQVRQSESRSAGPTTTKASVTARLSTLTLEMTCPQFRKFKQDWTVYNQINPKQQLIYTTRVTMKYRCHSFKYFRNFFLFIFSIPYEYDEERKYLGKTYLSCSTWGKLVGVWETSL